MARRQTFSGWALFVLTACSKSFLDISRFRQDGTFDTIFYGRGLFSSHPICCCVNILLDVAAVLGAITVTRTAAAAAQNAITTMWNRADR